ncbi:hypothetical protein Tco_1066181 [Tanacetum coccineum]
MLDSRGFIPLMTPTQALKSIQVMAEHSYDWYDETTIRGRINDSSNNVYAIQASFKRARLTKECPLKKEDKEVEQSKTTMGKENVKESVPRDLLVVQTYVPPTQFLGSPYSTHETICAIEIPEEIQEDERDMNDGCDITVEDIERLRKILPPSIYTLTNLEPIVQPYVLLGLVCNKAKVKREEEQDYDIPLQDHVMQPLTQFTSHRPMTIM